MYVTRFWFHSKLVLEKAKKPASYDLAIHQRSLNNRKRESQAAYLIDSFY